MGLQKGHEGLDDITGNILFHRKEEYVLVLLVYVANKRLTHPL